MTDPISTYNPAADTPLGDTHPDVAGAARDQVAGGVARQKVVAAPGPKLFDHRAQRELDIADQPIGVRSLRRA